MGILCKFISFNIKFLKKIRTSNNYEKRPLKKLFLITSILLIFFNSYSQTYYEKLIGKSNPYGKNVNFSDDSGVQDIKRSVGFFVEFNGNKLVNQCSCNLLNNVEQDKTVYISTAEHCIKDYPSDLNIKSYLSFDYEIDNAIKKGDNVQDKKISQIYLIKYSVAFKDTASDLALLEITSNNIGLLDYAYAAAWDNTVNHKTWSSISHPAGDHKKLYINPSKTELMYEIKKTAGSSLSRKGYFYKHGNNWNGVKIKPEAGSSGSGEFLKSKKITAITSSINNEIQESKSSAIFNKWYGFENSENCFFKYLDPNKTWLNSIPGGYYNDLISTTNNEYKLTMVANQIVETPSTSESDTAKLDEEVLWLNPSILYHALNWKKNTPTVNAPIWLKILGIKASNINNSELVLSMFYLEKETNSGKYNKRLIYGTYANSLTTPELDFKGQSWDCDDPSGNYAPCDRLGIGDYFPTKSNSQEFKQRPLRWLFNLAKRKKKTISLKESKIPITVELKNIRSNTVYVEAVSYPGDVPKNALQLFKPQEVASKFKSYRYRHSILNSELLHIETIKVEQNNSENKKYSKTISTSNNGGYLNLVNPNFKIGPIKASTDEQNKKSVKFKIELHNPNNQTFSYRVWIDYFKHKKEGGNTNLEENYTYNFVEDPEPHPEELLKEDTNISGNVIEFEEELPLYSAIVLNKNDKRLTRLRIAVKTGGIPPTQSEKIGVGEVEDYLIEIAAPTDSELEEIELEKVFDKISMADGSSENAGISPPQGESGNRLGSGNDDASINNDLAFLYNDNTNQNLEMADFLVDFGDAINAVQVGVNAILFDGIAKIMVGGATGGGSDGDFIYGPYSKHTSTYDLIPDLICEDLNGDGQCDNRRLTNSNTAYQIVYEEGGGENGLSLRFNGTNIQYGVRINNRLEVIDYSYDLVPNQYTNFTIGFNEGEMELYINGSKVATNNNFATTGIRTIPQHLDPAGLAGIAGTGTIWEDDSENVNFHGMIDYFGYTNKTLTEAQITNLTTPTNNNNARQIKNTHSKKVKQNIATKEPDFSIFPNPVKENLNILLEVQQTGPLHLSLFDLNGKQVYEMKHPMINKGHQLIELKNLRLLTAHYILKIKAGNTYKEERIIFE